MDELNYFIDNEDYDLDSFIKEVKLLKSNEMVIQYRCIISRLSLCEKELFDLRGKILDILRQKNGQEFCPHPMYATYGTNEFINNHNAR